MSSHPETSAPYIGTPSMFCPDLFCGVAKRHYIWKCPSFAKAKSALSPMNNKIRVSPPTDSALDRSEGEVSDDDQPIVDEHSGGSLLSEGWSYWRDDSLTSGIVARRSAGRLSP